jgi:predicted solute-binding protein
MAEILKEARNKNTHIDKIVSKKIISKLSLEAKKILCYFAFFRHEISANILKTIDHFPNIQKELSILKEHMFIEGEKNLNDFLLKTE